MKTKLTLTIDRAVLPGAKRYARERGISLSALVESTLRELTDAEPPPPFSARWQGRMALVERDDERFRALMDRYGESPG